MYGGRLSTFIIHVTKLRIKIHASIPQYLHPPRFNRRSRRREPANAVATVRESAKNTAIRAITREKIRAYREETRARIAVRRRWRQIVIPAECRIIVAATLRR